MDELSANRGRRVAECPQVKIMRLEEKAAEQAAELARFWDFGWAIHNTARGHVVGSLTVIGTDEYIAMLDVLNGTGG